MGVDSGNVAQNIKNGAYKISYFLVKKQIIQNIINQKQIKCNEIWKPN